jgi:hypothetical protein
MAMGARPSVKNQTRGALCAGHWGVLGDAGSSVAVLLVMI